MFVVGKVYNYRGGWGVNKIQVTEVSEGRVRGRFLVTPPEKVSDMWNCDQKQAHLYLFKTCLMELNDA